MINKEIFFKNTLMFIENEKPDLLINDIKNKLQFIINTCFDNGCECELSLPWHFDENVLNIIVHKDYVALKISYDLKRNDNVLLINCKEMKFSNVDLWFTAGFKNIGDFYFNIFDLDSFFACDNGEGFLKMLEIINNP